MKIWKFVLQSSKTKLQKKYQLFKFGFYFPQGFTGMTKEELMKYANDPFWVRLRWIFFILFWALWIAMLAGAILIILKAPKCSKPVPLSWFKEGPLVQLPAINSNKNLIEDLKSINAKGVIYQLPADKTYAVETREVQDYVKNLVEQFKNTSIHVILDLTPNYVTTENELYKWALNNETYRSAFVWAERARKPNNWVPKVVDKDGNKDGGKENSAWKQVKTDNFVLSQFGVNNIDLQLNDPIAKEKFKDVLRSLMKLGVRGFRLANAKHYIIDPSLPEEIPDTNAAKQAVTNEYYFYTHRATTNQPGIGDLLHEFWKVVNNDTNGEGFLSVSEKIDDPIPFQTKHGIIGFDLPIVSVLPYALTKNSTDNLATSLSKELTNVVKTYGNRTWVQWMCEKQTLSKSNIGISEYNIFLFLLPGVPVGTLDEFTGENATNVEEITKLEKIRETQSYQHGSFDVYTDLNDTVIAYSRYGSIKYFIHSSNK